MKNSRLHRVVSIILTIGIVMVLFAGCGSGDKAAAGDASAAAVEQSASAPAESAAAASTQAEVKADPPVTIRLLTRYSGSDPQAPWLKEMMDRFTALHPNVTFQDDSIAEEAAYTNKLKTDIATGTVANMFIIYGCASLAEYAKNGLLMDMSPVIAADPEWAGGFIDTKFDYYNLEKYGVKGIYGIPTSYSPEVIYYNTELFKQAGIEKKPETMDDLYAAIEKLKAINVVPWGAGAKDTWRTGHIHNNLVYRAAGVQKMKDIGIRTAKWTDPEVILSLQTLKDLKAKGAFEKNLEGIDFPTEEAMFLGGKSAMMCNGTWEIPNIMKSDIKDKVDFFPFPYFADKPQFKGDSVLFTNGHLFSGSLKGYERDITIEFAKFQSSKEETQIRWDKYGIFPVRKDVDTSKSSIKLQNDIAAYTATVTNPGGDYFDYDTLPSMIDVSRNNIIGMLLGATAEEAAAAIQKEIDRSGK